MSVRNLGRGLFFTGLGLCTGVLLSMIVTGPAPVGWIAVLICAAIWACGAVLIAFNTEHISDDALNAYLLDEWEPECPNHGKRFCLMSQKDCPNARERVR